MPGAEQPNIVLIVADDLGYNDLGCYGSSVHDTPHIDALAARGLRFTDFHSGGSMCSPTRASLMTGLYPQRFGSQFDGALSAKNSHSGLPLEAETIAEALRKSGYTTGCFGKWHLGYEDPLLPNQQGFDEFRGLLSGDGDFHTRVDRSGNEDWWENNKAVKESGYTTDLLTQHSVEFIKQNRANPFFLYLPHLAIHFPWQGPSDPPHRVAGSNYHEDKFGVIPEPGNVAPHVKGMVESLDKGVGEIIAALNELDLIENTLVVFTSDNGGYVNYGKHFQKISSNAPYRGQKTEVFEGGHRVPAIFSWPGRINPGISEVLTHSNDLFPTFQRIAGLDPAEGDGIDLTFHLLKSEDLPNRNLYWRTRTHGAVRSGPWKLCATRNKAELYQLTDDPAESNDLADRYPEKVEELTHAWQAWETDVNATANSYGLSTE
ncbi:MAG: sulfatase-like hydrolase/transferase [Verrucomicrobiales bacterium]|nr:sulfatase-like hydrolase/transferase [Verrucomicrobiales bacterium]